MAMHRAMALHPVLLWPKARRKAREWGRSSRHGRKLVKVAHRIGHAVAKHCRVSEEELDDDSSSSSRGSSSSSSSQEFEVAEQQQQLGEGDGQGLAASVFFKLLLLGLLLLGLRHLYQLLAIAGLLLADVAVLVGSKLVERSTSPSNSGGALAAALLWLVLTSLTLSGMVPATLATTAAWYVLSKLGRSLAPPAVLVSRRQL